MLDQNTDRMWFVIGAVIVGAAIIFIANGTLPTLFASVKDTFSDSADGALEVVETISPAQTFEQRLAEVGDYTTDGINLLPASSMTPFGLNYLDTSRYESTGVVKFKTTTGLYSGIRLMRDDLPELEPHMVYTLSYSFRKIDGTIDRFGGHVASDLLPNKAFINGIETDYVYADENIVHDDGSTQTVVVHFITPHSISAIRDERGIWLQPNRYDSGKWAEVELTNLQLVKGLDVTPWSAYGK